MLRKTVEASLILLLSVAATVLVVALIAPTHPLGDRAGSAPSSAVRPAVLVDGAGPRAVAGPAAQTCPFLALRAARPDSPCPYLRAVAAASSCPFGAGVDAPRACPRARGAEPRPGAGAKRGLMLLASSERPDAGATLGG
jgi:hypothetical protein